MNRRIVAAGALLVLAASLSAAAAKEPVRAGTNWPSFRGPGASGVAEGYATPTTWDAEKGVNVRWKTAIPGLGHSSPVVWGNRVFLTSALSGQEKPELRVGLYGDIASANDDTTHNWNVYCLDRTTGRILWQKTAHRGVPRTKRHTKATQANPTVATDGKRVVASFGSEGLYCYDVNGKLLWKKDLGVLDSGFFAVPSAQWGFASSPVIHGEMLLIQCDVQKNSFIAAFSLKDGRQIWRTPRSDVPTWSTPTVLVEGGREQVVVNGFKQIAGYDLRTGRELWTLKGGGDIPVPTPVTGHGLIYITNAHGRLAPIYAIRSGAVGDISLKGDERSNAHVAWSHHREGGYMQTPLVYGDYLYVCRDNGVLSCYDAKTGARLYQERLGSGRTGFTASPVAADGKIYFTSEDGDIYVVKAGPKYQLLATNPMGEICMATPAVSGGMLLFRTQGHVVAVGQPR